MNRTICGWSLGVLIACPGLLTAQTPQGAPQAPGTVPQFKTEIVVTPERSETPANLVPASSVVLDAATARTLPGVILAEICSAIPGVQFQQSQPYAVRPIVSARGFFGGGEAEYVLLLIDGVPVSDAESGLVDWSVIPTSSIRRIEAYRGPGASLYGDSAIGGVIQILTDRSATGGTLTATGGSFGTFTADGSYGVRQPSYGMALTGSALRTDGFSDHSAGQHLVATGSLDGRIHGAQGPLWRLTLNANEREREDPGALPLDVLEADPTRSDPLSRFDEVDRHAFGGAFSIQRTGDRSHQRARVNAQARSEDLVRTILLAPELGDRRARALSTSAFGGSVEAGRTFGAASGGATALVGVDLSREHVDTSYRAVDEQGTPGDVDGVADGARVRSAVFASTAWRPAPRLRLMGALRWDRIADDFDSGATSRTDQAWSPRAGATVLLDDSGSTSLFAQVSRAFKAPTVDQLFDPRPFPDFQGGSFTISNASLVPQRATNVEAGVAGGSRVRWSALAYRINVEDEIDFDVRTFSYANIGQSRHTGIELEATGRVTARFQPSLTYALSRVTVPGGSLQLKNVPRHVFTAAATLDLPHGVGAYVRFKHTAGAFLDDENAFPIEGPATLDLRVRRSFGRQMLFADFLNLTDANYQEYGFTLADFQGGSHPYAYPGSPRAVRVGVSASF